jgi:DNA-binding GntR family transcriptional regulator
MNSGRDLVAMVEAPNGMAHYQTKSAYAAARLRQAVSEGTYGPGDRLQIAKLAKDFNLSLTPVREALLELASEGLVDIEPHRGARVADVPVTDLTEAYLVRERLESAATRLAAERASDEFSAALAACHSQFVEAVEAGELEALRRLSDGFHGLIYDMAQSPLLRRLIRDALGSAPSDTFTLIKDRAQHSVHYHEEILKAILLRDGDAAESLMTAHIRDSLELILTAKAESVGT